MTKATMMQAIKTRELFTLDGGGVLVCGTFHRPLRCESSTSQSRPGSSIGLVFINAFSAPRAYVGDSAVFWAEQFAAQGYPCFRLDLPGLGDSDGKTPPELLNFITDGGYSTVASSKVKELMARFHLSGVIFVGHCAGAVTSIFAASLGKECKGLILMDPYFHSIAGMRSRLRLRFTSWAKQQPMAVPLSLVYARLRAIQRALRSNGAPANANLPLLTSWKHIASRGLPILVLMSPDWGTLAAKEKSDQFDYISHIQALAGRSSQVRVQRVSSTDHSFANHEGRRAMLHHVGEWLSHHFPWETQGEHADHGLDAYTRNERTEQEREPLPDADCRINSSWAVQDYSRSEESAGVLGRASESTA